jgi:hypothetical protein
MRIGDPQQAGAKLRSALAPLAKQEGRLKEKGYVAGAQYWPIYRRLPAPDAWWEAPESWGQFLAGSLSDAWIDLSPPIDAALAADSGQVIAGSHIG